MTSQKNKHFRKGYNKEGWKLGTARLFSNTEKIGKEEESFGWVFRSSKNEGIKVFRGIISMIIEIRTQGQFSSSSDYQYTETRSKNTSTVLGQK